MKLSLAFILDCDDFGSEMGPHEALTICIPWSLDKQYGLVRNKS